MARKPVSKTKAKEDKDPYWVDALAQGLSVLHAFDTDRPSLTLSEIAERSGFAGRLVVLAAPDMVVGDCRIEWADGGATRDQAALQVAIGDAVERYLAVRRADGADDLRSRKP